MTAKELKDISITRLSPNGDPKIVFTIDEFSQFCEALCREQREICAGKVSGWPAKCKLESEIEEDILEAEMPEL
jgi:hypothetical protein